MHATCIPLEDNGTGIAPKLLLPAGVSHEALKYADQSIIIPQSSGFVDSFNVSVAAALILYEAFTWRVRTLGKHGDLSEEQQRVLMAAMLLRHKVSFTWSNCGHFSSIHDMSLLCGLLVKTILSIVLTHCFICLFA